MAKWYEYWVTIDGDDFDFECEEWCGCNKRIEDICFDTYDEARSFVLGITKEQAVSYEKKAGTNSLDITVYKETVIDGHYDDVCAVGFADWIEDRFNHSDFWIEED